MKTIYIIGCGATKAATPQPAYLLYTGALFKAALDYAINSGASKAEIAILSAKHGLLPLNKIVEPYNTRWNDPEAICKAQLFFQIKERDWHRVHFVLLCPADYATRLLDAYRDLHSEHAEFEAPLRGLGIGQQIKWLRDNAPQICRRCGRTRQQVEASLSWMIQPDLCTYCQKQERSLDEI